MRPKMTETEIAAKLKIYREAAETAQKDRDTLKYLNTEKRQHLREHYGAQLAILKHQEAEAQRKYANARAAYRDFYKKHCLNKEL